MKVNQETAVLLVADDDADDRLLIREALTECNFTGIVNFVENGEEVVDYIYQKGRYCEAPTPNLILLDLNMPRKDGREALKQIKSDPQLRHIPVIAFTTSNTSEDILYTYTWGVNSYIVKPVLFDNLVIVMKTLIQYWFELVKLPAEQTKRPSTFIS